MSSDIVGSPASCTFDAGLTMVMPVDADTTLVKVQGWYDNEWGYANRLVDLVVLLGSAGPAAVLSAARGRRRGDGRRLTWRGPTAARWRACPCSRTCPTWRAGASSSASTSTCPSGHGPDGEVVVDDDFRIRAALPTLSWLTDRGAAVTACTHLGRPKGTPDPRYDVAPVRARLAELAPGVALLENLRFDPGEEANDPAFVDRLVDGFDAYVNDAFGASHRAHASIVGPPTRAALGRRAPAGARGGDPRRACSCDPARPFVAVVGGAKVARQARGAARPAGPVDRLVVGGGMAFTFLAAQGHNVGRLAARRRAASTAAPSSWRRPGTASCFPPTSSPSGPGGTIGEGGGGTGEVRMVGADIPAGLAGPRHRARERRHLRRRRGRRRHGVLERAHGGVRGRALRGRHPHRGRGGGRAPGLQLVGGGDSVSALDHLGLAGRVGFVSTGGGASLELLEHGDLPGLEALRHASNAPGGGA